MIVATVFGLTQGFESIIYAAKGKELPFDPPNEYIQSAIRYVNPSFDTEFFMVRRFSVNEGVLTFIGVYRGVYEIGYDRPNSYYGAGLWLLNRTVDGSLAQKFLTDLADQLKNSAISDNRFIKKIADTSVKISTADLAKLATTDQPNTEGLSPEDSSQQCFIKAQSDASHLINWAQADFTAQYFNRMYAGNPAQMISTSARSDSPLLFLSTEEATEACLHKIAIDAAELKRLHAQLSTKQEALQADIDGLKEKVEISAKAIKDLTKERNQLEQDLDQLKAKYAPLKKTNNDLSQKIGNLEQDNKTLKANLEKAQKTIRPSIAEGLSKLENKQPPSETDDNVGRNNSGLLLLMLLTLSLPIHTILNWLIDPSRCFTLGGFGFRPDIWLSLGALWVLLSSLVIFFSKDLVARFLSILLIGMLVAIAAFSLHHLSPSTVCTKGTGKIVAPLSDASTSALPTASPSVQSNDPVPQNVDTVSTSTTGNKISGNTSNPKPSESAETLSNAANPTSTPILTIDLNSCVGSSKVPFKAFKMTYAPQASASADVTSTLRDLRGRLAKCIDTVSSFPKCQADLEGFTDKWRATKDPVALVMPESCAQTYQIPINPRDAKKVIEYRFEAINSVNSSPQ